MPKSNVDGDCDDDDGDGPGRMTGELFEAVLLVFCKRFSTSDFVERERMRN